ncbi:hypothetical protein ACWNYH_00635 [Candidatus Vidania fulgoroideorum]
MLGNKRKIFIRNKTNLYNKELINLICKKEKIKALVINDCNTLIVKEIIENKKGQNIFITYPESSLDKNISSSWLKKNLIRLIFINKNQADKVLEIGNKEVNKMIKINIPIKINIEEKIYLINNREISNFPIIKELIKNFKLSKKNKKPYPKFSKIKFLV